MDAIPALGPPPNRPQARSPLQPLSPAQLSSRSNSAVSSPARSRPVRSRSSRSRSSRTPAGDMQSADPPTRSIRLVESVASIRFQDALTLDPTPAPSAEHSSDLSEPASAADSLPEGFNDENEPPYEFPEYASSDLSLRSSHSVYHKSPFPTHPAHILRPTHGSRIALARLDTAAHSSDTSLHSAYSEASSAGSHLSDASQNSRRARARRSVRHRHRPADLHADTSATVADALAFFSALSSRSEQELQRQEQIRTRSRSRARSRRSVTPADQTPSRPSTGASETMLALPGLGDWPHGRDSAVRLSGVSAHKVADAASTYPENAPVPVPELPPQFAEPSARDTNKLDQTNPEAVTPSEQLTSTISPTEGENDAPPVVDEHTIRMVSSIATIRPQTDSSSLNMPSMPSSPNFVVHATSNSSLASSYNRWKGLAAKPSISTLRDVEEEEQSDHSSDRSSTAEMTASSPNFVTYGPSSPYLAAQDELPPAADGGSISSQISARRPRSNHLPNLSVWTGRGQADDSHIASSPPLAFTDRSSGIATNRASVGNTFGSLGLGPSPYPGVAMPVSSDIRASVISQTSNAVDTPLSAVNTNWIADQMGDIAEEKSVHTAIAEIDRECDDIVTIRRHSIDTDALSRLTSRSEFSIVSVAVPVPLFFRRSCPPTPSMMSIPSHSRSTTTLDDFSCIHHSSASPLRHQPSIASFAASLPEWARAYYSEGKSGIPRLAHMSSTATLARVFASNVSLHNLYQLHSAQPIGPYKPRLSIDGSSEAASAPVLRAVKSLMAPRRVGRFSNLRAAANGGGTAPLDPIPSEASSTYDDPVLLTETIAYSTAQSSRNVSGETKMAEPNSTSTSVTTSPLSSSYADHSRLSTGKSLAPASRHSARISLFGSMYQESVGPAYGSSFVSSRMHHPADQRQSKRFSLLSPPSMEYLRFQSYNRPSSAIVPSESVMSSRRASVFRPYSATPALMSPQEQRRSMLTSPEMAHFASPQMAGAYSGTAVNGAMIPITSDEEMAILQIESEIKSAHRKFVSQIVLFLVGFVMPVCWIVASFLPIPASTDEGEEKPSLLKRLFFFGRPGSRASPPPSPVISQLEYVPGSEKYGADLVHSELGFHPAGPQHHAGGRSALDVAADQEEQCGTLYSPDIARLHTKATWWRHLNRIMSVVGLCIIGAIIAVVVTSV